MNEPQSLRARLGSGTPVLGCWLELFDPLVAEIMAQAGYDCAMLDLEHGPGSVLDTIPLMQAMKGTGCVPLTRVPSNDPVWINRVLDAGVSGVMVPSVNTADEARAAVMSCHYAPRGKRGMGAPVVRAADFGHDWLGYVQRTAPDVLVICQIETAQAVENVHAIATVDGVDLLFLGPFDLSASLGHLGEPDHPDVDAAFREVRDTARAAGKLLGTIPTAGRPASALFQQGFDLVLASADLTLLRVAARNEVKALRQARTVSESQSARARSKADDA